jgi:hypothetical protein
MGCARSGVVLCALLALTLGAARAGQAGNLTSAAELAAVANAAAQGSQSAQDAIASLRSDATQSWRWGTVGGKFVTTDGAQKTCHPESDAAQVTYLKDGAPDAYAKVLAYHVRALSDETARRALAADARTRVLDLVDTTGYLGFGGLDWSASNQCILDLAVSIPVWIETALLLAETPVWTAADRAAFARWLGDVVYPKVAWASRVRRNNWGAAGSLSASLVARYVNGSVSELAEVSPAAKKLSPSAAWQQHDQQQLQRIATSWAGDSPCTIYGVQTHGGIPDELRRGAGGCAATFVPSASDSGLSYQTMHVELLVYHAEALRRAGSNALFDAKTAGGARAIQQAILFVIANPTSGGLSWPWGTRTGALRLAYRAYGDARIAQAVSSGSGFRGGRTLPYVALSSLAPATSPAPTPPAAPPPPTLLD